MGNPMGISKKSMEIPWECLNPVPEIKIPPRALPEQISLPRSSQITLRASSGRNVRSNGRKSKGNRKLRTEKGNTDVPYRGVGGCKGSNNTGKGKLGLRAPGRRPYEFIIQRFINEFCEREKDWRSKGGKFILPIPDLKIISPVVSSVTGQRMYPSSLIGRKFLFKFPESLLICVL